MKKNQFSLMLMFIFMASFCHEVGAQTMESANDAVANMRIGWNCGNSLDSHSNDTINMWIEKWTDRTPKDYEEAWKQKQSSLALMQMMHEAGFNAIRVPVTWYPHLKDTWNLDGKVWHPSVDTLGYEVNSEWMARVREVVDYVISTGMYCIINVHHDTGASNTVWLKATTANYEQRKSLYHHLWEQIATEFRDYGDHLLFEGYNEMLDGDNSWSFASYATKGKYDKAKAADAYEAVNDYAQTFVNTVRATGGNNSERNLIVTTYGGCDGHGDWSTHLKEPLKEMRLPEDQAEGHLIFEVHSYPDIKDLDKAKGQIDDLLDALETNLSSKGAPVIIGEWGTLTNDAYNSYNQNLLDFAEYFVSHAKAKGFATFYWMGLSDGDDRGVPKFTQPDVRDAIVKGYYGEGGYTGINRVKSNNGESPSEVYNLIGQRIAGKPTCGIYITGGKKRIVGE